MVCVTLMCFTLGMWLMGVFSSVSHLAFVLLVLFLVKHFDKRFVSEDNKETNNNPYQAVVMSENNLQPWMNSLVFCFWTQLSDCLPFAEQQQRGHDNKRRWVAGRGKAVWGWQWRGVHSGSHWPKHYSWPEWCEQSTNTQIHTLGFARTYAHMRKKEC